MQFKIGDRVRSNQPGQKYTGTITVIDGEIQRVRVLRDDTKENWLCKIVDNKIATANGQWDGVSYLKLIKTAASDMLVKLTEEQKSILTAEDQSLIEAGYMNCDFTPTDDGKRALKRYLFNKNKAAMAAEAAKIVAEAKKAEKVSK